MNVFNTPFNQDFIPDTTADYEYVNTELPDGESVRFKRVWGGYRFTDADVDALLNAEDIVINTEKTKGVRGGLDWMTYNGHEYYGFAPWAAEAYTRDIAPIPTQWNSHVFTDEEIAGFRRGESVIVISTSSRTGSDYAVKTTFDLIQDGDNSRWGIIPHFDDFNRKADDFTREDCTFMPMFGGEVIPHDAVMALRQGKAVKFKGLSKKGNRYTCWLELRIDHKMRRWRIIPEFI